MDQEAKEKIIVDVFKYTRENAKADYAEKKRIYISIDSVVGKVDEAKKAGINVGLYFAAQKISETKNDIDPKRGESIKKRGGKPEDQEDQSGRIHRHTPPIFRAERCPDEAQ